MSVVEVANKYVAVHAFALQPLVIEQPSGRTFRVPPGVIFVASPETAKKAAHAGLVRAVDAAADRQAPVSSGDRALFSQYGAGFFELAYYDARLAIKIELYKEPPPARDSDAMIEVLRPDPRPPAPLTGFEHP
jgi:hypothetical protein